MSAEDQLQEAADKATLASEQARVWAEGPVNTTVPTDSGPVPTIAEFMRINQEAIDDGLAVGAAYQAATITAGAVTLNAATAGTWGVLLNQNITALSLAGSLSGQATTIEAIFSQPGDTAYSVAAPSGVVLESGRTKLIDESVGSITLVRFTTVNNGLTWFAMVLAVFAELPGFTLPVITGENATFNDEGTATTGWTTSNATLSVTGSWLRQTKTAGGSNSSMTKSLGTFPPTNSDFILYGKVRTKYSGTSQAVVWLLNGAKKITLWFGTADGGTPAQGTIALITDSGSGENKVTLVTGYDYESNAVEFALHFDQKFQTVTAWFKEADGRWKWKGRAPMTWISAADIQMLHSTGSAAGSWIEFDYLTLARPNFAVLSDSIGEGKTLFSPDPALALTNDDSTWMRHAPIYPALRNNLIVNKGVGSQTSAQMLSRVADVTSTGAKLVFLHASSNDSVGGISQATRTSNIQSTVNAINAAGSQTVLLNAVYGTSSNANNPGLHDYMKTWWGTSMPTVTGVAAAINIMRPIDVAGEYMDPTLTQSDNIHPNIAGYTAIGQYIAQ